jgi:type II secretory pathway predicted ATPase ExeA
MKAFAAFNLKENPFVPSPNPRFLYLTDQTNACLFKCRFVIDERQGLSLIVGKIGYGKTSVLRELVNGYLDNETYQIALLPNGSFPTEMQLAKAIASELGIPAKRSLNAQVNAIRDYAFELYMQGKSVILIIDEGQNLKGAQFDFLRELLNFESNEAKTIQIIVAGQPEIETKLTTKPALVSRIILTNYLDTFTYEDMVAALTHRIVVAGGKSIKQIMDEDAIKTLYVSSRGVPREVMKIANASLLLAAIQDINLITEDVIKVAVENIMRTNTNGNQEAA